MAALKFSPARVLLALLLFASAALAQDPKRFAGEIEAFAAADAIHPPPKNAILFIGSSSIRRWDTLARDFPGRTVINRGFGGSLMSDSVYYFDRIVTPCQPAQIILYAGSNDINGGKTPEQVLRDFQAFVAKTRKQLPQTRVDFISIGTSPSRWGDVEKVKEANRLIRDWIAQDDKLGYIVHRFIKTFTECRWSAMLWGTWLESPNSRHWFSRLRN